MSAVGMETRLRYVLPQDLRSTHGRVMTGTPAHIRGTGRWTGRNG
ncbi:MAG TPA: hypothetical protein VNG12_19870 [Acidimicrobiales bacterium]|nr:hypothetical protein [Acidimicrobiales bacterium]